MHSGGFLSGHERAAGLEWVFTVCPTEDVGATAKAVERAVCQLRFPGFLHWHHGKRQPGRWSLLRFLTGGLAQPRTGQTPLLGCRVQHWPQGVRVSHGALRMGAGEEHYLVPPLWLVSGLLVFPPTCEVRRWQ